jgi:uncharacterized HAD superfamily protein
MLRIGIDLDNTLADYRRPLQRLCADHGVSGHCKDPKLALREALRALGKAGEWTRYQGELYGPLMREAELFAGAAEVVRKWQQSGCDVCVVSHRTKYPIAGQKHDLHAFARSWIESVKLPVADLFFEESKEAKVARIESLGCDLFIDDLPEVLDHPGFPATTRKILFDPGCSHSLQPDIASAATWAEIELLADS